jgi:hypothetical protein
MRIAASVASVVAVPESTDGSILIIVDSSLALVTAEIFAPGSTRLATTMRFDAFVCAAEDAADAMGAVVVSFSLGTGELERRWVDWFDSAPLLIG